MRTPAFVAVFLVATAIPATAAPVYFGLGDSITFGETDLVYIPSLGDRGYVGRFADTLAAREGVRPSIINLAIDGETAGSFQDGTGRTPPVVGRNDAILAGQNLNYAGQTATPQRTLFASRAAAALAGGDTIETISITLGFNELAAIALLPNALDLLPTTLADYRANQSANLSFIGSIAPTADLYLLGYFNPFPGDPTNPANPFFAVAGPQINAIIAELAADLGAIYVDTAPGFVGREAELTFIDEQPDGFFLGVGPFPGVEPIGNVHPNDAGYTVIATAVASADAVPAPASMGVLGLGLAFAAAMRRRA